MEENVLPLEELVGCHGLKKYGKELQSIEEDLLRLKEQDSFPAEHLIFSINEGQGCTTALQALWAELKQRELHPMRKYYFEQFGFQELVFRKSIHGLENQEQMTNDFLEDLEESGIGLVAIHMEAWLNDLASPYFIRLLRRINQEDFRKIVVFVIPKVENRVLKRVESRIGDLLNCKSISFSDLSSESLTKITVERLSQYGISLETTSEKYLKKAIGNLKSNRSFFNVRRIYGIIDKIALYCAEKGDLSLKKSDFQILFPEEVLDTEISGKELLERMVGQEEVKKRVYEMVLAAKSQKKLFQEGRILNRPCYHMLFTGNPGTGKTEIARIVGKLFKENGLLKEGELIEVTRTDLVGEYIGQTGPKTIEVCRTAMGSVLFIDEAYLLATNPRDPLSKDFGVEAIGALIAEMENHRDEFVVIMAGYEEDMDIMLSANSGLRGRIPHKINFQSYTKEELYLIFEREATEKYLYGEDFLEKAKDAFMNLDESVMKKRNFSNGRMVRNLLERVKMKALLRMGSEKIAMGEKPILLPVDLEVALLDRDIFDWNQEEKKNRIGFGRE